MAKTVKIKLNGAGVRELLKSNEVASDLERRAQAIANAAGAEYEVVQSQSSQRARAKVQPATARAYYDNLENNTLARAIGAGRK